MKIKYVLICLCLGLSGCRDENSPTEGATVIKVIDNGKTEMDKRYHVFAEHLWGMGKVYSVTWEFNTNTKFEPGDKVMFRKENNK